MIQIFRANGITGWRRGSKLPGKPDFVFPKLKTAVFVDGCFWHGCPQHATWPKTRAAFWKNKIETNRARDRRVNSALRKRGWIVVRVWQHELKRRDESKLFRRLSKFVSSPPARKPGKAGPRPKLPLPPRLDRLASRP